VNKLNFLITFLLDGNSFNFEEMDLSNNTVFMSWPLPLIAEIHTNLKKEGDSDAFL
jgi:hypothetical protein